MNAADSPVLWPEPARWERDELVRRLGVLMRGRVREAYLVGSYARGTADADSDVDMILVCDTVRAWPERWADFPDLFDEFGEVDLLVYTPAEWERLRRDGSPFLSHASQDWLQIC